MHCGNLNDNLNDICEIELAWLKTTQLKNYSKELLNSSYFQTVSSISIKLLQNFSLFKCVKFKLQMKRFCWENFCNKAFSLYALENVILGKLVCHEYNIKKIKHGKILGCWKNFWKPLFLLHISKYISEGQFKFIRLINRKLLNKIKVGEYDCKK